MKCKFTKYCGGCKNVNDDYNLTLESKQKYINEVFKDICVPNRIVANYYPYKYRNKLQLAFTELKGKTLVGFFEEGSIRVADIDGCILNGDYSFVVIKIIREYMSRFKIRPYAFGSGILRYLHARCIDNKIQLTLCVTTDNFAGRNWLLDKLQENFDEVSLYLNINRRTDRAIFDNQFKFVGGTKYLNFEMCGVKVSIEPASFLQVNLKIAEKMYKSALENLELKDTTTVVDLYSGIGITSIMFSKKCKNVIAIEENKRAVGNAIQMAKLNSVHNINFHVGKCEENLDKLTQMDDMVVFVDPARNGLEKSVIQKILSLKPRKIVYMSCNPETCVRDIKLLFSDNNYQVSDITPYDMFAFANHIEILTVLDRV